MARDAGTHLYHAHSGMQRAEGLFGAIVVRQKKDLHESEYDFDLVEHVIVLNDWFADSTAEKKFTTFVHDKKSGANPDAILVNGKGIQQQNSSDKMQTPASPRAIFRVVRGKRYRFRLISAGVVACPIQFSIENHIFKVISSDGQPIRNEKEADLEAIVIFAGVSILYLR